MYTVVRYLEPPGDCQFRGSSRATHMQVANPHFQICFVLPLGLNSQSR